MTGETDAQESQRPMPGQYEVRSWTVEDMEIREDSDGMHFRGYAAVFNVDSEPRPYIEQIRPGAFTRSLKNGRDIRMFLNHNQDMVLGSTKAGTLRLEQDKKGLIADGDLPDTTYARDLSVVMQRGDVDTMSFGFRVPADGDTWESDRRYLKEVNLFEVSPITGFPGYPQTSAYVRSVAEWIGTEAEPLAEALRIMTSDHGRLDLEQIGLLESVIDVHREIPKPVRRQFWEGEFARLS